MHFFAILALKIKLMVRRPIAQLVDQGIIPCKYDKFCSEFFFYLRNYNDHSHRKWVRNKKF